MSTIPQRPEIVMWCPVEGCTKVAECYDGPTNDVAAAEPLFRACVEAAVDALALHIREDHIGHDSTCPRRTDRNDLCDCHVGGYTFGREMS